MSRIKEHRFYLSFKVKGEIINGFFSGINLRHAKEKLMYEYMEASDIMDWTHEKMDDLLIYVDKQRKRHTLQTQRLYNTMQ